MLLALETIANLPETKEKKKQLPTLGDAVRGEYPHSPRLAFLKDHESPTFTRGWTTLMGEIQHSLLDGRRRGNHAPYLKVRMGKRSSRSRRLWRQRVEKVRDRPQPGLDSRGRHAACSSLLPSWLAAELAAVKHG